MNLLLAFFMLLLLNFSVWSQNPVEVNVTSLTISKDYLRFPFGSLTATGLPAPYQSPLSGFGGGIIGNLEGCRPCLLGTSLRTSFGPDSSLWGFNINGYGSEKRVKFYLTSASPDIVLAPTIGIKNKTVIRRVPATVKGKIEIYDGNTLIAFDNEVVLTGIFAADFLQYRLSNPNGDRRGFDFRSLTISYFQPPLQ